MDSLSTALLLGLVAGIPIPLGAWLSKVENLKNKWAETELRHFVIAFGGGALLSAVALVLVPEGSEGLAIWQSALFFSLGGIAFMGLDVLLSRSKSQASQLTAMLSDFLPEAIALGAAVANGDSGMLLAFLIAIQNLPEGFNAFQEVSTGGKKDGRVLGIFCLLALVGPLSTWIGHQFLAEATLAVHGMMLFASGGILYLIFQDIAPQARIKQHWLPPLGAIAGFLLGLIGHLLSKTG